MIYYGFITNEATVVIIGTDRQEVESQFTTNGLSESNIQKKQVAKFTCSTDSFMITLTGFEIKEPHKTAIKQEIATLQAESSKAVVKTYTDAINAVLTS